MIRMDLRHFDKEIILNFLEAIQSQVIVIDGAMGTMIQDLDLTDLDFGGPDYRMLGDLLTFSNPESIVTIHRRYYESGSNGVETNTFGASPFRLSEYDFSDLDLTNFAGLPEGLDIQSASYEDIAYEMNKVSAELACKARDEYAASKEYDGRPLFVIGSIGPSNRVLSKTQADLKESTFDDVMDNFYHQVLGLVDGGADVLLYETQQDILEVKAAVMGGQRAMKEKGVKLPIMVQVTVDQFSKMQIFNTDIHAALVTVEGIGIDMFGINCSIGPDLMIKTVETLSKYSRLPISVIPNAGLPESIAGQTVYKFTPDMLADYLEEFVTKYGVSVVGGCCGTGPDHIRAIADKVKGLTPVKRDVDKTRYLSGPQEAVSLDSKDALIRVGERLNVRGSKAIRDAVESGGDIDHDVLEEVAREQIVDLGLMVIDVCMDSNQVDTTETLVEVIHEHTGDFAGAMSIDSFGVDALEAGIKAYPGRPIINSMSMEEVADGVTKVQAVIEATGAHHPMYVALAAGPLGPAATREDKAALAKEIVEESGRFGVTPDQLIIDMNVFPLGSESVPSMNFALESLEAIPLIKAVHPDLMTICGVGNLTNGLAKKPYMRKVLTSVWLDEGRKRGLDAAIVNPNHYVFVQDIDAHDYDLALKAILERDMDAFEELEIIAEKKVGIVNERRTSYDDLGLEDAICQKIFDGHKERESGSAEHEGHTYEYADRIVLQAMEAVKSHEPLVLINDYLMASMQRLGDGFGRGEVSLPHLLKSADVMKQVMGFLEEYMRVKSGVDIHTEIQYKGTIILGTVYQDVHSIGKDLAKTLFENYGYRVIDLGVMTPLQEYIDKAREYNADAIGMSALLVQTSNHMISVSKMMEEQGLTDTAVLIGGAPVSYRHAAYVALAGDEDVNHMRKNVFYCATAMDGVNVMSELVTADHREKYLAENFEKLTKRYERAEVRAREDEELLKTLPARQISFDEYRIPENPWFPPEKIEMSVIEFGDQINKRNLYSLNWRFGGKSKQKKVGVSNEKLEALYDEWTQRVTDEGWLRPQGILSVFPCYREGNNVVVMDIVDTNKELCRFDFDTVIGSSKEDTLCGAHFFREKDSNSFDAIGIQIASTGPDISAPLVAFKEAGDTESALFLQGLSDRLAEDMAHYIHGTLREKLGMADESVGTRWSPGYPAITEMENNRRIFDLLNAEALIGASITEAGEFYPTGCTAAIVSFHPDARYS